MRLKSFTAETLPEAMRLIRDSLGTDAIILSTQPAESGTGVRVTAALEDSPLDELYIGSEPASYLDLDTIAEVLSFHRIPAGLFDRLIGHAVSLSTQDSVMALAGAMDSEFTFAALPAPLTAHPTMLVGPPGAGKTATAAKLCARARLAGRSCALITMDTGKSGGLAQAEAFAQALEATLLQAERPEALPDAVSACGDGHFTVIDTAGANPFLDADMALLKEAASASRAQLVLVLPAGGDAAESAESAAAFKGVGATGMIATRLDTARRFGGLLSAAAAGSLDLLAMSASPRIGDPLHPVNPVSLARMFLPDKLAGTSNDQTQDLKQWSKQ